MILLNKLVGAPVDEHSRSQRFFVLLVALAAKMESPLEVLHHVVGLLPEYRDRGPSAFSDEDPSESARSVASWFST